MKPLFAIVVALCLVLGASPAESQTPGASGPISGRILEIDDSRFPTVRAIVTILDSSGRPLRGLGSNAFQVTETGVAGGIERVETVLDQNLRLAVILTVDVSGSMTGASIEQARVAASAFVSSLDAGDHVAVLSFANDAVVQQPLGQDKNLARTAVGRLQAIGNTALYSAVGLSVETGRNSTLARRAIVLLSDGIDFGGVSSIDRAASLRLAGEAGIPIYAIGLGPSVDRSYLTELANASGGAYLEAPTPDRVPAIYDQISQLLRSQYVITIQSSAPAEIADRSVLMRIQTPGGPIELSSNYRTRRSILPPMPPDSPAAEVTDRDQNGSSLLILTGIASIVAIASASGFIMQRRQRSRHVELARMTLRASQEIGEAPATDEDGVPPPSPIELTIKTGTHMGLSFLLGAEPLRIGSGQQCQVRLDDSPQVAPEHVRVWWRSGRLMYHRVADKHALVNGREVDWAILEDGDSIEVGPNTLTVRASS